MYKNLLSVSCSTPAEIFRHIKDWLSCNYGIEDYTSLGLGWTLHDYYFASSDSDIVDTGDWLVFYSPGEDGNQDLYYYVELATLANSIIKTRTGLYYDASTDTWVEPYPAADIVGGPTTGSVFSLSIYGSLDSFSILIGNGTTTYGRHFGTATATMHDPTVATTAGAVSAGTSVVVAVDSVPSSWAVGKNIFIRDNAVFEKAEIEAIDGTDITLTLTNSYSSGAKLARDLSTWITKGTSFLSEGYQAVTHAGVVGDNNIVLGVIDDFLPGIADPDPMNNSHLPSTIGIYGDAPNGFYGEFRDILYISSTGITSGNSYLDENTGIDWRAYLVDGKTYLFKEVIPS